MPRPKKEVSVLDNDGVLEPTVSADVVPEVAQEVEAKTEVAPEKSVEAPVVSPNGLYQVVQVKGGYIVFSPVGQQISDVLPQGKAEELARRMNTFLPRPKGV